MPDVEIDPEVTDAVMDHTVTTNHSVIWKTDGTLADAQCTGCSWPND